MVGTRVYVPVAFLPAHFTRAGPFGRYYLSAFEQRVFYSCKYLSTKRQTSRRLVSRYGLDRLVVFGRHGSFPAGFTVVKSYYSKRHMRAGPAIFDQNDATNGTDERCPRAPRGRGEKFNCILLRVRAPYINVSARRRITIIISYNFLLLFFKKKKS